MARDSRDGVSRRSILKPGGKYATSQLLSEKHRRAMLKIDKFDRKRIFVENGGGDLNSGSCYSPNVIITPQVNSMVA